MALFYLDASALAKRYKQEKGSNVVDFVFERQGDARLATSFLAIVELTGAVARLRMSKTLSEVRAAEFFSQFREEMVSRVELFPVSDGILAVAVGLAERHGLRAADAIHLATMTEMARGSVTTGTAFLSLVVDKALRNATEKEGIIVVNPEDENAVEKIRSIK